eukprot:4067959-Prymnesium_polylepis.1
MCPRVIMWETTHMRATTVNEHGRRLENLGYMNASPNPRRDQIFALGATLAPVQSSTAAASLR